jgi:hypothetical protein
LIIIIIIIIIIVIVIIIIIIPKAAPADYHFSAMEISERNATRLAGLFRLFHL